MKTPCCDYECPASLPYPVHWNQGSGVVQCHNCGEPYVPVKISGAAAQRLIDMMTIKNSLLREDLAHYRNNPPPHPA